MNTTPDALRNAISIFRSAYGHKRQPAHQSAVAMAIALAEERDALVDKIEKRWSWCDANPAHTSFIDREEAVIADIALYCAMQDALNDAADVLWGKVA